MDKKEFEKKLERDIKNFKEVPISVNQKIQMAYQKIEEKEKNMENKKVYSVKLSKILSMAASFIIVVVLAGNGIAYAKGEDNIYSWLLEKIGITKEYEEVKNEINQTVENSGLKITLLDCAYDANKFIVQYKVEDIEGKIEEINKSYQLTLASDVKGDIYDSIYWDANYTFYTDENQIVMNPQDNMGYELNFLSYKSEEKEFVVCQTIPISEVEWKGKITEVSIRVGTVSFIGADPNIMGNWEFKVTNLKDKYRKYGYYIIDVNQQIDNLLKINSIRIENPGIFGEIQIDYDLKDEYLTETNGGYLIQLVNTEDDVLGECSLNVEQSTIPITYKYIPKLNDGEEYKILIYSNNNIDDIRSGKVKPIKVVEFRYQ